jgi:maleate isomerase
MLGIGWRAKLGILIPSINYVMEPEFNRMAPKGVSVHAARLKVGREEYGLGKKMFEFFNLMAKNVEKEAELLGCVADVIGYGCTSGSFAMGNKWNEELIKRIEKAAGVPTTTTSTAMCEALREMGVKKLALVTPYPDSVNRLEKNFLKNNGFKVVSTKSCECNIHGLQGEYSPHVAYRLAKEANVEEADGIFISCTNFRTIEILEKLEHDTNKPVISSNSVTFWKMLKMAGIHEPIKGYGQLLEKL